MQQGYHVSKRSRLRSLNVVYLRPTSTISPMRREPLAQLSCHFEFNGYDLDERARLRRNLSQCSVRVLGRDTQPDTPCTRRARKMAASAGPDPWLRVHAFGTEGLGGHAGAYCGLGGCRASTTVPMRARSWSGAIGLLSLSRWRVQDQRHDHCQAACACQQGNLRG